VVKVEKNIRFSLNKHKNYIWLSIPLLALCNLKNITVYSKEK